MLRAQDNAQPMDAVFNVTRAAANQEERGLVVLEILRIQDPSANHAANAKEIIPAAANRLLDIGLKHDPDFDQFRPTYTPGLGAAKLGVFRIIMPNSYKSILLHDPEPFYAGSDGQGYQVRPQDAEEPDGFEKEVDTGINWAHVILNQRSILSHDQLDRMIKNTFSRAGLKVVKTKALLDKTTGTMQNKYRVSFELTYDFHIRKLPPLASFTGGDNLNYYTDFSLEFNKVHGLHRKCLKPRDTSLHPSARCRCAHE